MYVEPDKRAKECVDELNRLKSDRVNFNTTWETIARLVLPTSIGFTTTYAPGTNLNSEIFDATAQLALPKFAAAIDSLVTPHQSRWHGLTPRSKPLRKNPRVMKFLYDLTDTLFAVRYSPKAFFRTRVYEAYGSMGAFGNGVLYIYDAKPGIRYMSVHLSEIYFDENAFGVIDKAYWEHEYTVNQILEKFPDAKLPEDLTRDLTKTGHLKKKCLHVVKPRLKRDPRQKNTMNMAFESLDIMVDGFIKLKESGYRTFPFAICRYNTAPREIYGRGPAHDVLADIKTLNEMSKTSLRAGQQATDPSLLTMDDDSLSPFSAAPGAINSGWLDEKGNPRIKPLELTGKPEFGLELAEQRRLVINNAFLISLFQVLIDTGSDRMTATEVMQKVQEKGALLGPIGGRIQAEFLGPMIERELDILFAAGVISQSDIPEELIAAGGDYDIEYDSPLTRAMKAEEGVGILRTTEAIMQLANIDKGVIKKLNISRIADRLAEINGAPPDILFTDEELAERAEEEKQAMAMQEMVAAAPALADTAKTLAEAQQIAGGQPQVI